MDKSEPSGILVVNKPAGITSHDVVDIARRLFKIKRIGHAGTLDPIATGVLLILVGSATKKSALLMGGDKEYEVGMRLGVATDTGDALGNTISSAGTQDLTAAAVERAIMDFNGDIEQVPPMFSAVKFKGRSLYKWAREGIEVPRKARKVTVRHLSIREIRLPDVRFDVVCSKGAYMRQLCSDIGDRLGCGGHMAFLRRARSGDFHISQALGLERLRAMTKDELYGVLIA